MGDSSTCLMQPFSYVSAPPYDPMEGNPIHSLHQSISFGRFVSDSVSWEKWSIFSNNNRYVEEAERFSRPGSVAQKKAFFEAHYKKMAARKAAALLEQRANSPSSEDQEPDTNGRTEVEAKVEVEGKCNRTCSVSNGDELDQNVDVEDKEVIFSSDKEDSGQELDVMIQLGDSGVGIGERKSDTEDKEVIAANLETISTGLSMEVVEDEQKENGTPEMEKPLLMQQQKSVDHEVPVTKKKAAMFSSKLFGCGKGAKHHQTLHSPAKPATPIHFRKEIFATPNSKKKLLLDLADRKRTTPNVSALNYFTPARNGDGANSKAVPPRKIGAKDCPTPSVVTPSIVMATANGTSRPSLATSRSTTRRTPTCDRSAAESRSADPKKRSLATDWSKFLSSCKSKLQSPSLSSPFRLKTEERACRRKEKLEEKFNADQAQNQRAPPQLAKSKEKDELDLKKFRQSLCFKARPLPDFYKEKEGAPKNCPKKVPFPSSLSSQQPGRKPKVVAAVQNAADPLLLPQRPPPPPIRMNQSKRVQGKSGQTPIKSRICKPSKSVFENMSPNILQQW